MGQIELNCVLMLIWIVWNRTVFDIETAYLWKTELFQIEMFKIELYNVLLVNWIVWNRTDLTFRCL